MCKRMFKKKFHKKSQYIGRICSICIDILIYQKIYGVFQLVQIFNYFDFKKILEIARVHSISRGRKVQVYIID
jgi:hypothetical protein